MNQIELRRMNRRIRIATILVVTVAAIWLILAYQ